MLVLAALACAVQAAAQTRNVPLTVYVPEQAEYLPDIARAAMANKMRQVVNLNGMGATDDRGQFYITCTVSVTDKEVLGTAPAKIAQKMDVTFYVADALDRKVYGTATVSVRGVGDNQNKAYIAALKQIAPTQPALKNLIRDANAKIIAYYQEQCDNILQQAQTLALAKNYEAAFFRLSLIPEACDACYAKVLTMANTLFQKYIDDLAQANLAKARSIWNAGQDRDAAIEAGEYLAQILPDATCYPQAEALAAEIKAKVREDLDFYRQMYVRQVEYEQRNTQDAIKAWRDVGVAYGNNQQAITYAPVFVD